MTDDEAKKLESDLAYFIGTEVWFPHPVFRRISWTEGVHYLIEHAECMWLIDMIVFNQQQFPVKREKFQEWKLVRSGKKAVLTCEDGNGNHVWTHNIDYTDFPLEEIRLWFCDNVLMLPTEY